MSKENCVELCDGCPLREFIPDNEFGLGISRHLEKVGETVEPQVDISDDRSSVEISLDNVRGPRLAEIAILSEESHSGPAFMVSLQTWENGRVHEAFDACNKPKTHRTGFLNMGKQVVCGGLERVRQEEPRE